MIPNLACPLRNSFPRLAQLATLWRPFATAIPATPARSRRRPAVSSPLVPRTRVYPLRKQFIYESYLHLLTQHDVCLLFRHDSLTPQEWNALRGGLAGASARAGAGSVLQIQVIRTKILPPVLKHLFSRGRISRSTYTALKPHLQGTLAALTQPVFDPPSLLRALALVQQHSGVPSRAQLAARPVQKRPGGDQPIDRLPFVVGLVDRALFADRPAVERLARLPPIDVLHQQIVGLLSGVAGRLATHIQLAGGSALVRTLDGFRETLRREASSSTKPEQTL